MSETENSDVEEALTEDETDSELAPVDLKTYFKIQVISVARQVLCCCSVMVFPIIDSFYSKLMDVSQNAYRMINQKDVDKMIEAEANALLKAYQTSSTAIIAFTVSGIALYLVGRKFTVIIANIFHLAILVIHTPYMNKMEKTLPYVYTFAPKFVKEFSFVPYCIYVAEITSPTVRPVILGLYLSNEFLISIALDPKENAQLILILAAITCLSLIAAMFIPETPFWQLLTGNPENSQETFTWLRAGNPDMLEFYQMSSRAEDLLEKKTIQFVPYLASRTLVVGMLLSISIAFCTFKPNDMMRSLIYDFWIPDKTQTADKSISDRIYEFFEDLKRIKLMNESYGLLIFLVASFALPRKILFLLSHVFSIFIIVVVTHVLMPMNLLMELSKFIHFASFFGIKPLSVVLPIEIYPAALREIGAVLTVILITLITETYTRFQVRVKLTGNSYLVTTPLVSYTICIGSFLGIIFILMFMPETRGKNIYQLEELNLQLQFGGRAVIEEDAIIEDAAIEDAAIEDAAIEDAAIEDEGDD